MKIARWFLTFALALILLHGANTPSHAAESSGGVWIAGPGDLVFNRGGLRSRFIVFETWSATTNYPAGSMVQHSNDVYISLADPDDRRRTRK